MGAREERVARRTGHGAREDRGTDAPRAQSIIKGWLDPKVVHKVVFVTDKKVVLELVDANQLPVEYGGERVEPYPIEGLGELVDAGLYAPP